MNDCVKLYKNGGFYSAFEESALVIFALFGYKIVNNRVGFPLGSYEKVKSKLEEHKINYQNVVDNIIKDFQEDNSFLTYVEIGKKKFDYKYRIDNILEKLESLSENKIDDIINYIEDITK